MKRAREGEREREEERKLPKEMESNGKSRSTRRGEKLVEHQLPRLDGMLLMGSEKYRKRSLLIGSEKYRKRREVVQTVRNRAW